MNSNFLTSEAFRKKLQLCKGVQLTNLDFTIPGTNTVADHLRGLPAGFPGTLIGVYVTAVQSAPRWHIRSCVRFPLRCRSTKFRPAGVFELRAFEALRRFGMGRCNRPQPAVSASVEMRSRRCPQVAVRDERGSDGRVALVAPVNQRSGRLPPLF